MKLYKQLFDSVTKLEAENIENAKTLEELIRDFSKRPIFSIAF